MYGKQLAPAAPDSTRRHVAGAHASRPRLHREMARVAATAELAAMLASPFQGPSVGELVSVVGARLAATSTGTYRDVTCDALSSAVHAHLRARRPVVLADLAASTGAPASSLTDDAGILAALQSAGVAVASLDGTSLNRYRRRVVARPYFELRDLDDLAVRITSGDIRAALVAAWDDITDAPPLDTVIASLIARGIAGERLAGDAIRFEAQRHEKLIWQQAHKLSRVFPDRDAADLVGWGWQGLVTALRRYDPEMCMLSTYACPKIAGAIRDGVRSEDPLPKRLTTYKRKVAAVSETLTQSLGRTPSLAEVAERIGADLKDQALIARLTACASIDELCAQLDGDRAAEPTWLADADQAAESSVWSVARLDIEAALDELPAEEAEAIRLLDLERLEVVEVRARTGATARQLRQRRARGHAALRSRLSAWEDAVVA